MTLSEPVETLLVVDDNEDNRDLLARRLERSGFQVRVAAGGEEALAVVGREPVDLVLLDIMMPEVSGIDVLKRVRSERSPAELPIIMVTAKAESDDMVEALDLGANDYVTKPLDFPVALARIRSQLRARRLHKPYVPPEPKEVGVGEVLAGKYRLVERIGFGNFGTVYRAQHVALEHVVAVKVLQTGLRDEDALERFRREGMTSCRIQHPNAVRTFDFGITERGIAYLVMELLEGHSLEDELLAEKPLTVERTVRLMVPVCDALEQAHRAGIVHRDIKPANIFVNTTPQGEVSKILDFGIAKMIGDAVSAQRLTMDGWVLGTPGYMAPERFTGKPLDSKSDVYAVGVTLYQMLTGKLPFDPPDPDPLAVAMLHLREPPPPIRLHNPDISSDVESVVLQALRKKPEKRPSCYELGAALTHAAGGSRERMKSGLGPIARLVAAVRDARADAATGTYEVRSGS